VDRSIEFLNSCPPEQPFSLSIIFNDAHADDDALRQYWWDPSTEHLYRDVTIPEPTTSTAELECVKAMPTYLYTQCNRQRWWQRYRSPETYQEMMKGYYRIITGVDMAIGRLVSGLKKLGRDKNTIIFIMGENGVFVGERGFGGKYLMYDISLRTPFIIYNPQSSDSRRGRIIEQMVLNLDIAPTILELAGIDNPGLMYGSSLIPLMRGEQVPWRTGFLCQHLSKSAPSICRTEGYRTERWKYIRYPDFEHSEELYDLVNDPDEGKNLAGEVKYQKKLAELRNRCNQEIKKALSEKKNENPLQDWERGY
jgi:arylsulfatase A-like enzyme